VVLAPDLAKPDEAYPSMMQLLPSGVLGLVFAALVAAVIASTASKINSIATIFTLDLYAKHGKAKEEHTLVRIGRTAAIVATILGIIAARPLLGSFDQAFQYIQEYTGFFTPGIVVIFLLGLFWKPATEAGALAATIGSFGLSLILKLAMPELPFMDRMGVVFLLALVLAVVVSLLKPVDRATNTIETGGMSYATTMGWNIGALGVVMILAALYSTWW
jgi:SSS family solute:Na+ symporter